MVSKFTTKIIKKEPLTKNTFLFTLDSVPFDFKAGQFLTFIMRNEQGKPKPRSYSLFSAPKKFPVQLLVECIDGGVAGEAFKVATQDTEFTVMGPLGKFHFQKEHKKHVFIATNTGMAPFNSMITQHLDEGYDITLIFGGRTKERLYFHDKFTALNTANNSFSYYPTLSRENIEGIAFGYVQKIIPYEKDTQYYICGNDKMVKDSIKILNENNIPKTNINYEIF